MLIWTQSHEDPRAPEKPTFWNSSTGELVGVICLGVTFYILSLIVSVYQ